MYIWRVGQPLKLNFRVPHAFRRLQKVRVSPIEASSRTPLWATPSAVHYLSLLQASPIAWHRAQGRSILKGSQQGAHAAKKSSVSNVLCAIDFNGREQDAIWWAARLASETRAGLTITHVAKGLRFWGPGGTYTDPRWKEALVHDASERIAGMCQNLGVKAKVIVGSGDAAAMLYQAAQRTSADVLVAGSYPYAGHMRTHGYSTIRTMPIPVLSV